MTIQRIVCFKFKPGLSRQAVDQHMADFAGMQADIPEILEYRGGFTRPGDFNAPPDYDTMHYMTYADMAAVDVYFHHPAHRRFIERNRDSWDGVLVMNAELAP